QADTLRQTRSETRAKRLILPDNYEVYQGVPAEKLEAGDLVVCEAGDIIPGDGEVIEGIASVNEAGITGESAPVIRESGGDRSAAAAWVGWCPSMCSPCRAAQSRQGATSIRSSSTRPARSRLAIGWRSRSSRFRARARRRRRKRRCSRAKRTKPLRVAPS